MNERICCDDGCVPVSAREMKICEMEQSLRSELLEMDKNVRTLFSLLSKEEMAEINSTEPSNLYENVQINLSLVKTINRNIETIRQKF